MLNPAHPASFTNSSNVFKQREKNISKLYIRKIKLKQKKSYITVKAVKDIEKKLDANCIPKKFTKEI